MTILWIIFIYFYLFWIQYALQIMAYSFNCTSEDDYKNLMLEKSKRTKNLVVAIKKKHTYVNLELSLK